MTEAPPILYVAMGYERRADGSEHVVCCGVFEDRAAASVALSGEVNPGRYFSHVNILEVFAGVKMRVAVFQTG